MENLPFGRPGRFFKGNLHSHSTESDGDHAPAAVIEAYRAAGYDFLALTDHFLAEYDWPITDTRDLRTADFTTLIGAELHAPRTSLGEAWHIKAIGLPFDFAPNGEGESGPELATRAAQSGAFVGLVHPSWYGLTRADADSIPCAHAIEIYNHGSAVEVDRGSDWPYCDALLNDGRRVTGYASDDSHHMTHDCFGGWVQVWAEDLDPELILESLKAGRFYSSQGPEIHDIRIEDGEAAIVCSPASAIVAVGRGSRSSTVRGAGISEARLSIRRFAGSYVRITVIDEAGRCAWSNPIWLQ